MRASITQENQAELDRCTCGAGARYRQDWRPRHCRRAHVFNPAVPGLQRARIEVRGAPLAWPDSCMLRASGPLTCGGGNGLQLGSEVTPTHVARSAEYVAYLTRHPIGASQAPGGPTPLAGAGRLTPHAWHAPARRSQPPASPPTPPKHPPCRQHPPSPTDTARSHPAQGPHYRRHWHSGQLPLGGNPPRSGQVPHTRNQLFWQSTLLASTTQSLIRPAVHPSHGTHLGPTA